MRAPHLMQIGGGVRQAAPTREEVVFRPLFQGDSNETAVPTLHGAIRASWKRGETGVDARLDLRRESGPASSCRG